MLLLEIDLVKPRSVSGRIHEIISNIVLITDSIKKLNIKSSPDDSIQLWNKK
jgi:hypothetical protein